MSKAEIAPFEFKKLPKRLLNSKCSCCHELDAKYAIKIHGNKLKSTYFTVCGCCFNILGWQAARQVTQTSSIFSNYVTK